jgi:glycosyltransferase involved in cell wall biosynthesis
MQQIGLGAERNAIRLAVVTPVHNDWASFTRLIEALDRELRGSCGELVVFAVDDGSAEKPPVIDGPFVVLKRVEVLRLAINLGHQRAIATGLAHVAAHNFDCVIIMDCDGEDRPEDARALTARHSHDPAKVIVAERAKRSECMQFRVFYTLYKIAFISLTGVRIAHGNFCLIPAARLSAILHSSNTWNNLAASIVKSRVPYTGIPTVRGSRYHGTSGMNFTSLLLHGLSAVSVYLDIVATRVLIACTMMLTFLIAMLAFIIMIRLFTDLAIPGWATMSFGLISVIIIQLLMLSSSVLFTLLNSRGQSSVIPIVEATRYIQEIKIVYGYQKTRSLAT